ncbi:DnaJ domain-containing protein [Biscogniauxia marginata]|nr:DnaJ domain-containing protein [Biscogniauxia marginata]
MIPRLSESEDPRGGYQSYNQHRQQRQYHRQTVNNDDNENIPPSTETYYEILNVPPNASPAELRAAHRQAARQYHPDRVCAADGAGLGVEGATERMIRINEAYDVLSDKGKRCEYDFKIGKRHGYAAYQRCW